MVDLLVVNHLTIHLLTINHLVMVDLLLLVDLLMVDLLLDNNHTVNHPMVEDSRHLRVNQTFLLILVVNHLVVCFFKMLVMDVLEWLMEDNTIAENSIVQLLTHTMERFLEKLRATLVGIHMEVKNTQQATFHTFLVHSV